MQTYSEEEQISVIHSLLEKLNIKSPIIAGASDGGLQAQLYTRKYRDIYALILMATATLDSEYLEPERKRPWLTGVLTTAMKHMPWKLASRILTRKVNTYYEGETFFTLITWCTEIGLVSIILPESAFSKGLYTFCMNGGMIIWFVRELIRESKSAIAKHCL